MIILITQGYKVATLHYKHTWGCKKPKLWEKATMLSLPIAADQRGEYRQYEPAGGGRNSHIK